MCSSKRLLLGSQLWYLLLLYLPLQKWRAFITQGKKGRRNIRISGGTRFAGRESVSQTERGLDGLTTYCVLLLPCINTWLHYCYIFFTMKDKYQSCIWGLHYLALVPWLSDVLDFKRPCFETSRDKMNTFIRPKLLYFFFFFMSIVAVEHPLNRTKTWPSCLCYDYARSSRCLATLSLQVNGRSLKIPLKVVLASSRLMRLTFSHRRRVKNWGKRLEKREKIDETRKTTGWCKIELHLTDALRHTAKQTEKGKRYRVGLAAPRGSLSGALCNEWSRWH